jgi:hypothetical protein
MKSEYFPEEEAPSSGGSSDADTMEGEEMGGETFLINNTALGGDPNVGDTYTVRVVATHDGQSECEVDNGSDKEDAEPGLEESGTESTPGPGRNRFRMERGMRGMMG